MNKRWVCLISAVFLILAAMAYGSAFSPKIAYRLSLVTHSPFWCRLIVFPQFAGDTFAPPRPISRYCVANVVARYGDIEDCFSINASDPTQAENMTHHCIDALANRLLEPALCKRIQYPTWHSLSMYNEEYQDKCRAGAIATEQQCISGFQTEGWAEGVAEQCYKYLAVNHQVRSICQRIQDEKDKSNCIEAVERATNTIY